LDSLDAVEVVMAVEEVRNVCSLMFLCNNLYLQEFGILIPDVEADEIQTAEQGMYPFHVT